jgi:hypothetical protein
LFSLGRIGKLSDRKKVTMSEQEDQARNLYKKLLETFFISSPDTLISIKAPGLHWCCTLTLENRYCAIYCFGNEGFAIEFYTNDIPNARGRSKREQEIILSAENWIKGCSLEKLLDNFNFINPGKRTLEKFWQQAIQSFPELNDCANISLEPTSNESFCLFFITGQRYCQISYNNQSKLPKCEFLWKDFHIFEFESNDNLETALIIKRWLYNYAMPSDLAMEFPKLVSGTLSECDDFDKVIEIEFIKSWDYIEKFYKTMPFANINVPKILEFINQLRQIGFDRKLRAGQTLSALILSRSLHHGLREGQFRLMFVFDNDSLDVFGSDSVWSVNSPRLSCPRIGLTPEIEEILKTLERVEIN